MAYAPTAGYCLAGNPMYRYSGGGGISIALNGLKKLFLQYHFTHYPFFVNYYFAIINTV